MIKQISSDSSFLDLVFQLHRLFSILATKTSYQYPGNSFFSKIPFAGIMPMQPVGQIIGAANVILSEYLTPKYINFKIHNRTCDSGASAPCATGLRYFPIPYKKHKRFLPNSLVL
jgi:hypothetical protein